MESSSVWHTAIFADQENQRVYQNHVSYPTEEPRKIRSINTAIISREEFSEEVSVQRRESQTPMLPIVYGYNVFLMSVDNCRLYPRNCWF